MSRPNVFVQILLGQRKSLHSRGLRVVSDAVTPACRNFVGTFCTPPTILATIPHSKATLQQVALRLAACTWAPSSASQLASAIRLLRLRLAELIRMKLETELHSLASAHLKNRDLEMVLALWGWTGELPRTLQSVGDSFSLTRERVRQIVSKFEKVYRRRKALLQGAYRSSPMTSKRSSRRDA